MIKIKHYAKISLNGIEWLDKKRLSVWLGQFVGKEVEITIERKKRPRTTGKDNELGNQNGYWRGVVVPMSAKALGYTVNEMHEVFLEEFAPRIYRDFGGKKVPITIRTSAMDTVQMAEFTELAVMEMANMGVVIPDPVKK